MTDLAIATDQLAKHYGPLHAVDGINLNVPRGTIYGFLGRNGAGKSTTIKMLLGLARPTAGAARVLGMDIRREHIAILQRTAFVSEKKTLWPKMTPAELVRLCRSFYPTWSNEAAEKYARVLEIPMTQRFDKLSNGNQTKTWLLLALAQGADLLILDEPSAALDPVVVDQFLHILADAPSDRGCTVFFSSHQLEEVEQIAEYTGIIEGGKLLVEGRLDDMKNDFRLITASGRALPEAASAEVVSVEREGDYCKYVVSGGADAFAARLRQNGANVAGVVPLGLREIFLQLVRKEQVCTSGNAGAATLSTSSSF